MTSQDELARRYGAPPRGRRVALGGVIGLVCAAFVVWLGWTIWGHTTPRVTSELQAWEVVDAHTVEVTMLVDVADPDVEATCRLRAYAEDHVTVGEHTFTPDPERRRQVTRVRTQREASAVESLGCTAPGQTRPR